MANILHVTMNWSGFPGAPGFSNFYFANTADLTGANSAVTKVQQFADALHFYLPANVTLQASTEVEVIDEENGDLVDVITATASSPAWVGTDTGIYAAPAGAVINFKTAGVHSGRRVRGRVFIVPLGGDQYQSDGSLLDATRTGLAAAGNAFITGGALGVWARPKGPPPVVAGKLYDALTASVADKVSILRSRRD